jgi:tetratricopeptide (TPR) repeat protein
MLRILLVLALLASPLLASGRARADDAAVEAKRLYAQGKVEFAQGNYVQAADLFERSYALSESTALLFNMAQAHRLAGAGHCATAVRLYKSYLAAEPEAENRKEVEERIAELGDCRGDVAPVPAPAPAPARAAFAPSEPARPAPPPTRVQGGLPTGPVLVSGAGAALLVAGGVLYARAWDKHREAEQVCPCYPGTYSDWEVLTNVSYALLAVGGATLAGGVTWWIAGEPSRSGGPTRAMLGVSGSF